MRCIVFLIPILLLFSCEKEENLIEQNLIEFLKGKVYQKDIPEGKRYVKFDLSVLQEDDTVNLKLGLNSRGKQYEGWVYYERHDDYINEKGCFTGYELQIGYNGVVSAVDFGLYQRWYTDTIIDNSTQFKLDGIYGQTWIVTKYSNGEISINHNGSENLDGGYSAMSLEDFNKLNCN